MKYFLLIFAISFLNTFCVQKNKAPGDILSREKMTEVIWNLIKAEEYVNYFVMKDSSRNKKEESIKLYEEVFRIQGTSLQQFRKSMTYYQERPYLLKVLMDSLRGYESKGVKEITVPSAIPDSSKQLIKKKPPRTN
ncbi:MAG: DUF4296 domain-containing protein [Chitinophagaceae bacterium]|nr:MAG: DUF4296 domain-containing protein [Chitinophagaceae bacterium]